MVLYERRLLTQFNTRIRVGCTALACLLMLSVLMAFSSIVLAASSITLNVPDTAVIGGTVHIAGSINDSGPLAGISLGITVKKPNDATYIVGESKSNSDGAFIFDFTLPGNAPQGTWQVSVAGGGATVNKTFTVNAAGASGVVIAVPSSVKQGSQIAFSGKVLQGNAAVGITVKDTNASIVFTNQATAAADGNYSCSYTVPAAAPMGNWTVDVAGGGTTGQASFMVTSGSSGNLTKVTVSGTIPGLIVDGEGYNLNQLTIVGYDKDNNILNIAGHTITWQIASGADLTHLIGSVLSGVKPGSGTVTATIDGITSNAVNFNVEGCFIATAAYGSYLDPHVRVLRDFRDHVLLSFDLGRQFVAFYYHYSPPVAIYIAKHEGLRTAVRLVLTPFILAMEQLEMVGLCLFMTGILIMVFKRKIRIV